MTRDATITSLAVFNPAGQLFRTTPAAHVALWLDLSDPDEVSTKAFAAPLAIDTGWDVVRRGDAVILVSGLAPNSGVQQMGILEFLK